MSAVQRIEHVHVIEVRLVIPGLLSGFIDQKPNLKVFDGSREPVVDLVGSQPVAKPEPVIEQPATDSRTLVELYEVLLSDRDKERKVSVKTVRDNHSVLTRFQRWADDSGKSAGLRPIQLLAVPGILRDFAEHIRAQPKGNSSAMANKAVGVIIKLGNACDAAKLISKKVERVSKSSINLMRPRTDQQRRIKGVPVTIDELRAMLAVIDECKWPRLGTVKPSVFWRVHLLSHFLYGFRSQD